MSAGTSRAQGSHRSTPPGSLVTLTEVTRRYGSGAVAVTAVDRASVTVDRGEMVGLAGPSGSGKTTLVNIVLGWERPDSGIVERSVSAAHWGHVAVVPQELGLLGELSVRENVMLPGRLGGLDVDDVDSVLATLALADLADRLPEELSMGERQRVAVARAVACHPSLLVADEPTAHQDERRADLVMEALRAVTVGGGGVLVATHDERLLALVDRVVRVVDGRIVGIS